MFIWAMAVVVTVVVATVVTTILARRDMRQMVRVSPATFSLISSKSYLHV